MKKILTIASVVMFITVFLGVGVICAQEMDKKLTKTVEDEHTKIVQRHKDFMQKINLGAQENAIKEKAQEKVKAEKISKQETNPPVSDTIIKKVNSETAMPGKKLSDNLIVDKNYKVEYLPDPQPGTQYTKPVGLPEKVIVYNPDGSVKESPQTTLNNDGIRHSMETVFRDKSSNLINYKTKYDANFDLNNDKKVDGFDQSLLRDILKQSDNTFNTIYSKMMTAVRDRLGTRAGDSNFLQGLDVNNDGKINIDDYEKISSAIGEGRSSIPVYGGPALREPEMPIPEKLDLPIPEKLINPGDSKRLPDLSEPKEPTPGLAPIGNKVGSSISATISIVNEVNDKMDVLESAKTDLPPGVSISSQVVMSRDAEQPTMKSKQ